MSIFTRSLTDDLASLVKNIDKQIDENESKRMAGFVVLLTDDPDQAEEDLKAFGEKHGVKNMPLTFFDGVAGPARYNIHKDAEVTVNMWVGGKVVKANRALKKGELDKKTVAAVAADTSKILN